MSTTTSRLPDAKAKLKEELEDKIFDYYTSIDQFGNFLHPPGDSVKHLLEKDEKRIEIENNELHEFIEIAFGARIPRVVVEPGHKAPFDFIADLYYERVQNALAFANRTGGKTYSTAILNVLDMLFKPSCEVASAGAILDQANKCYRYFSSFLRRKRFVRFFERYEKITGKSFIIKNIQSWTKFRNQSIQEVITGNEHGLRSPHPHKARIDEIDLIPWSVLQTGLSMAVSSGDGKIRGQNVFTSTRQNTHGSMQRLLDEAEAKGIKIYEWNIWEALEKCTRQCFDDPKHGCCPVYAFCKGKAHHCEGFYKIDDFISKVRIIDAEIWETEWLNTRPSKHKLVYNTFDSTKHIMTPEKLRKLTGATQPSAYWYRVSGLDFGSSPGHPTVYLKCCCLPMGSWLVFYEYYAEQRLIRDHAKAIKKSPFYLPSEFIFADHAAQERLELVHHGVRTKPANKEVLVGIDWCRTLMSGFLPDFKPQLYVWHECTELIKQLGQYQWPLKLDGTPDRTGLPKKQYDDGPDAMRYALYTFKTTHIEKYRARTIVGI